jgi:hypothetical protein
LQLLKTAAEGRNTNKAKAEEPHIQIMKRGS